MTTKTLYIIGNGFDLFHSIPSSYWNFRSYVEKHDRELFGALEDYFNSDELWSDFEGTLAYLDIDKIRDEASNFLVSYGTEDWSEAYNHDYQYEIDKRISLVSEKLIQHFTDWVLSLEQPTLSDLPLLLDRHAFFLNFNYTPTLQTVYCINEASVLHIHNKAVDKESKLILGHGWKPKLKEKAPITPEDKESYLYDEEGDPRVTEGEEILNQYFKDTYKPVEQVLIQHKSFFQSLKDLTNILVFGHSMSPVDLPYFEAIIAEIDIAKVIWQISYHKDTERQERIDTLVSLGVPEANIQLNKLEYFGENPDQGKLF